MNVGTIFNPIKPRCWFFSGILTLTFFGSKELANPIPVAKELPASVAMVIFFFKKFLREST